MLGLCVKADSSVFSMLCFLQTTHPIKRDPCQSTMNHSSPISEIIYTVEGRLGPTITVRPESTSRLQNQTILPQGDFNSSFEFLFTYMPSGRRKQARPRFRAEEGAAARCYPFRWGLNLRILAREEILANGCSSTLTAGSPSLRG